MRGHIVKRSKNSWTLVVRLPRDPLTGKRQQKWQTVNGTKKDAERELRALLTSLDTGCYVRPTKMTVGEYLEEWLRDFVATNTSPSTADGYADIIRAHVHPTLGSIPLAALEPSHLQAYYAKLLKSGRKDGKGGLSPKTVTNHHRVLSEALKHAVKRGILARNVAEAVDPPRYNQREMGTLGPEDVNSLLDAAKETHLSASSSTRPSTPVSGAVSC